MIVSQAKSATVHPSRGNIKIAAESYEIGGSAETLRRCGE